MATKIYRAEISKSRSKKGPFKVRYMAGNDELVTSSETLSSKQKCVTNILSMMKFCFTDSDLIRFRVVDKTSKVLSEYYLREDGEKFAIAE